MTSYRPITDTWILARPQLRGGVRYYGAYPGGFLQRARALMGVRLDQPMLHVCGGMARYYKHSRGYGPNDKTLDLDPLLNPDFIQDAGDPLPAGFDAMLADPPYSADDAKNYAPGPKKYPAPGRVLRRMLEAVPPGGRVGMLHYWAPRPPAGEIGRAAIFVAAVTVFVGFDNRVRLFSVYERSPFSARDERHEAAGGGEQD